MMNDASADRRGEVTRLLEAAREGERDALDRLLPLIYEELRGIARRQLARERAGHGRRALEVLEWEEAVRLDRVAATH